MAGLLRFCCCLNESRTRRIVLPGPVSVWNAEHRASRIVLVFFQDRQRRARRNICTHIFVVRDVQVEQRRFLVVAPAKVKGRFVCRRSREVELWHWLISLHVGDGGFAWAGEIRKAIPGRLAGSRSTSSKRTRRHRRRESVIKRGKPMVLCPGASAQGR